VAPPPTRIVRNGIYLANAGTYADPGVVVEIAQAAEQAGWEGLYIWDHLRFVTGAPAADAWITLAAVALNTTKLQLGPLVTALPRRRPHVVAHQLATLDRLSGGRVVFGAGTGGQTREFEAFGEPADARTRAEMLDEGLEVVSRLVSGEPVTHAGRYYTVDDVVLEPVPAAGRVPVWIGGNSRGALRRAARWDGWVASMTRDHKVVMTPDDVAEKADEIKRQRDGAAPFDVVVYGYTEAADDETPRSFEAVGATWWLEYFHDIRAPLQHVLARIESGPPNRRPQ
jgi:probable F420-dependent oxidoreductase